MNGTHSTTTARRPVVCHLIERLAYGGAEMLVHRLAAGMRGSGYEPMVCAFEGGPVAELLERDGIHVEVLGLRRRSVVDPRFALSAAGVLARLTRTLKQRRVDLIHAHLPDSIIWGALAGRLRGTPVIGTFHGLAMLPTDRGTIDPRNRLRSAMYRLAGRLSARTLAVSPPVREKLCRELGFDERKTVLLLNGIDTSAFGGASYPTATAASLGLQNRRVITCVGRLVENKGQQHLIEAMPAIIRRQPAASLLLVGGGPAREALQNLTRRLDVSRDVCFAGDRSDVPDLLAMTDVFVLPSYYEGIPLALVEAMAAGRPVVATAVPGNTDVIGNDGCGVLVPPKDAAALADAVIGLLDDPVTAAGMAERGRTRAREHFDLKRALGALEGLYDEVLAEHRQGRTA